MRLKFNLNGILVENPMWYLSNKQKMAKSRRLGVFTIWYGYNNSKHFTSVISPQASVSIELYRKFTKKL